MTCEHKRVKCVNCEFICMDCGTKLDKVPEPEPVNKPVKKSAKKTKAD